MCIDPVHSGYNDLVIQPARSGTREEKLDNVSASGRRVTVSLTGMATTNAHRAPELPWNTVRSSDTAEAVRQKKRVWVPWRELEGTRTACSPLRRVESGHKFSRYLGFRTTSTFLHVSSARTLQRQ